jgi:hypothetical protein
MACGRTCVIGEKGASATQAEARKSESDQRHLPRETGEIPQHFQLSAPLPRTTGDSPDMQTRSMQRATTPRTGDGRRTVARTTALSITDVPSEVLLARLPVCTLVTLQLCCSTWKDHVCRAWPALCSARFHPERLPISIPPSVLWRLTCSDAEDEAHICGLIDELSRLEHAWPGSVTYDLSQLEAKMHYLLEQRDAALRLPSDGALFFVLGASIAGESPVVTINGDNGPDYHPETDRFPWRISLDWLPWRDWRDWVEGGREDNDDSFGHQREREMPDGLAPPTLRTPLDQGYVYEEGVRVSMADTECLTDAQKHSLIQVATFSYGEDHLCSLYVQCMANKPRSMHALFVHPVTTPVSVLLPPALCTEACLSRSVPHAAQRADHLCQEYDEDLCTESRQAEDPPQLTYLLQTARLLIQRHTGQKRWAQAWHTTDLYSAFMERTSEGGGAFEKYCTGTQCP